MKILGDKHNSDMPDLSYNLTQEQFDKLSIVEFLISDLYDDIRENYCTFGDCDVTTLGLARLSLITNHLLCCIESERSECFDSLLGLITDILNLSKGHEQRYDRDYQRSPKSKLLEIVKGVLRDD